SATPVRCNRRSVRAAALRPAGGRTASSAAEAAAPCACAARARPRAARTDARTAAACTRTRRRRTRRRIPTGGQERLGFDDAAQLAEVPALVGRRPAAVVVLRAACGFRERVLLERIALEVVELA